MKRTRIGLTAAFGAAFLAAATSPAAAVGYSSVTEQLIWDLNWRLLAVAIPITVLVEGILIYTVWKFRDNDDPQPTQENRRLEITWTVATAIILLFVGVASYGVLANENVTATGPTVEEAQQSGDPVVVEVTGVQWLWQFEYPDAGVQTSNTVTVPANRTVIFKVTSNDVIHSFHVPGLGLKADAMPGQTNYIQTEMTEEGNYTLYCAEYCGTGHSKMLGTVEVVSQDEYQQWLDDQQSQ